MALMIAVLTFAVVAVIVLLISLLASTDSQPGSGSPPAWRR